MEDKIIFFRDGEIIGTVEFGEVNNENKFALTAELESSIAVVLVKGTAMTALNAAKETTLISVMNKLKEKTQKYLNDTDYIASKYVEEVLMKKEVLEEDFNAKYQEQLNKRAECREVIRVIKEKM